MPRVLPAVAAVLTIGFVGFVWWGHAGEASTGVWVGSVIAILGAVASAVVPAARARAHTAIVAGLMLTIAGFAATRALGCWPFAWDAFADGRYAGLIAVLTASVAIGLVRGALWARWATLAFAAASMLGGTLNSIRMLPSRDEGAWIAGIGVVGGLTLIAQMVRPSVVAYFARRAEHAVWASRDRLVRTARWAAIANFAAAPMLVLYAFGPSHALAPQTFTSALILAPVLFLGGSLIVMRRAVGAVVVGVGGVALIGHTAVTSHYTIAINQPVLAYYAAFWLPAAVLGIVAAALTISRLRR